jgi:hypothetical protein
MQEPVITSAEKDFIQEHLCDSVTALALGMGRLPHLNARRVLQQVAGYQVVAQKVPSWYANLDLLFPVSLSLEQCSSEAAARYKVSLLNRPEMGTMDRLADLTGGLGVDFSFLAAGRSKALYVERQPELCELAQHNFPALGLKKTEIRQGNGPEILGTLSEKLDVIFIDPARRNQRGGKMVALSDCEPDLTQIRSLLLSKASYVLVKLSPMLDISMALNDLPETVEVHIVSVDGECKELLFLLKSEMQALNSPLLYAVNLRSNASDQSFSFRKTQEQQALCRYAKTFAAYLYEPNASLLKAGAFSILTQAFEVQKLHPNSHLYTSRTLISDFPGRIFAVDSVFSYRSKEMKSQLTGITKANITVRNFPDTVADIRKKTGLKEGGEVYLFATTLYDGSKVLVKVHKI